MSLQTKFPQNMKKCSSKKDKYPKQQSEYKTMKYKEHLIEWRMSKLKKERLGYERVFKYLEDYMAKEDVIPRATTLCCHPANEAFSNN